MRWSTTTRQVSARCCRPRKPPAAAFGSYLRRSLGRGGCYGKGDKLEKGEEGLRGQAQEEISKNEEILGKCEGSFSVLGAGCYHCLYSSIS